MARCRDGPASMPTRCGQGRAPGLSRFSVRSRPRAAGEVVVGDVEVEPVDVGAAVLTPARFVGGVTTFGGEADRVGAVALQGALVPGEALALVAMPRHPDIDRLPLLGREQDRHSLNVALMHIGVERSPSRKAR